MYQKICEICGKEYESRDNRSRCCKDPKCVKEMHHLKYLNDTKECICSKCGKTYLATRKQSKNMCKDCVRSEDYSFKNTYEQRIICRQCGKIIKTVTKNLTNTPLYDNPSVTCDECKKLNNEKSSYRMKTNNPAFDAPITIEEYEQIKLNNNIQKQKIKEENISRNLQRMLTNNPMHNEKIKAKVMATLKEKRENGEIDCRSLIERTIRGTEV